MLEPTRRATHRSSHSGGERPGPNTTSSGHNTTKSVLFAQPDDSDADTSLQHIDPMPDHEHDEALDVTADALLEKTRGLDLGESLAFSERDEWARESVGRSSDEDEQSEEYDEDEEQEGEELGDEFEFDQ